MPLRLDRRQDGAALAVPGSRGLLSGIAVAVLFSAECPYPQRDVPVSDQAVLAAEEAEAARIRALNLPKPTDLPRLPHQPPPHWPVGIFHEDLEPILARSVEMTTVLQGWFHGRRFRVAAGSSKSDPTAGALDIGYFNRMRAPIGRGNSVTVDRSGPLTIIAFERGVVRLTSADGPGTATTCAATSCLRLAVPEWRQPRVGTGRRSRNEPGF